jgi:predicted RNA-binding protein with TRAM domain
MEDLVQQTTPEVQGPAAPVAAEAQPEQGQGRRFVRFKPLRVGEELDVKIETQGEKGDGIAKVKGLVLFVPGGEVGQEVRVKVVRVLRNFAVGEIIA